MTTTKMPFQVWILTLAAFAIGTAEFVIAGILKEVALTLHITVGTAGNLITAYALAIVIGGPILTLYLARFDKSRVLLGLMFLFIVSNIISWLSTDYTTLLISRILAGLTQGPFYGIGAVVAASLVPSNMAGRAVGQMFTGLTLANLLGVPAGAWVGTHFGWNTTFLVVAVLGIITAVAIKLSIPHTGGNTDKSLSSQIKSFWNSDLLSGLLITVLMWTGFMTFYGYISPVAQDVAGFKRADMPWILVIVGIGLVIGNMLGGKLADKNLRLSLILWPTAMIASLFLIGVVAHISYLFIITAFIFGVTSFANVPALQMRVMMYGGNAPELASTANISAFNLANALGGAIGSIVLDYCYHLISPEIFYLTSSKTTASLIPFAAIIVPFVGLIYFFTRIKKEKKQHVASD